MIVDVGRENWHVVSPGLVDSHPILSGLDENEEELTKLSGGVQMLIYGMVGWLSVVTVAAVCIFVGVYIRMSRVARSLDDAETGSSVSSKSSRFVFPCCTLKPWLLLLFIIIYLLHQTVANTNIKTQNIKPLQHKQ